MKKSKTYRLSELTIAMLRRLTKENGWNTTETEIIEFLIKRQYDWRFKDENYEQLIKGGYLRDKSQDSN